MTNQYEVVWSKTAESDLVSIIDYISEDSPHNARTVLRKIRQQLLLSYSHPMRGRIIPELKAFDIHQYHEIIVDLWRIIYRVADYCVIVLSVLDTRRNMEDILLNRFVRESPL